MQSEYWHIGIKSYKTGNVLLVSESGLKDCVFGTELKITGSKSAAIRKYLRGNLKGMIHRYAKVLDSTEMQYDSKNRIVVETI